MKLGGGAVFEGRRESAGSRRSARALDRRLAGRRTIMTSFRCLHSRAHKSPCRCCSPPISIITSSVVIIAMNIMMIIVTAISSSTSNSTSAGVARRGVIF